MGWLLKAFGADWIGLAVLAAIVALVSGALLVQHNKISKLEVALAQEKQGRSADRAAAAEAAASAAIASQEETSRRVAEQAEIADEAKKLTDQALADAARADAAGVSLRGAARAAATRCGASAGYPAAAGSSASASAPGMVLADVLGRLDSVAGELAKSLDAARIAGQLCERTYDALKAPPP
jgi:hypothetical protein